MTNPIIYNKTIDDIETIITRSLSVNQENKVSAGEVFTPLWLVSEMLDSLPKRLWNNPSLKWLDPGSGIGNFSMVVFHKLDNGLKSWEKNDAKRRKHIIQNMMYMIELSSVNVKIAKNIFGKEANIIENDYLDDIQKWQSKFGVDKFDIIFGNPPYNKNGMRGKGRSNPGLTNIWNKFVELSISIMKPNGFCLFFTPNSWTELKSSVSKKIIEKQLVLLKNFDVPTAYKIFDKKAGSLPLCYYLIENKKPYQETMIYDDLTSQFISFDVYKYHFIPNKNIQLVKRVLQKSTKNLKTFFKFTPPKVKKDTEMYFDTYSKSHPYPLLNYVHKKIYVSFSTEPSKLQDGRPKLILPNYSMGYPILDEKGILDVGGRTSYVIYVDDNKIDNLRKIQSFFLTDLALTLINSLKTAQKFLSTRTFTLFPDVTDWELSNINDKYLEKYFKLNDSDKQLIQEQLLHGEGNLTDGRRKEILQFDLTNYISSTNISEIVKFVSQK